MKVVCYANGESRVHFADAHAPYRSTVVKSYQLKSQRVARMSELCAPKTVWLLVMG